QCLTYTTEPLSQPGFSGAQRTRVKVRARNACNIGIPSDDSWFEITSVANGTGATIGRETARFQGPIAPMSHDTETMVEVDCPPDLPGGCRYSVAVWWAAGGGRAPHR